MKNKTNSNFIIRIRTGKYLIFDYTINKKNEKMNEMYVRK